jgi:hypothetical protein
LHHGLVIDYRCNNRRYVARSVVGVRIPSLALAAALLSGCSVMPHQQVIGVYGLDTTYIKLNPIEVAAECSNRMGMPAFMAILTTPLACATIYLERWSCEIVYSEMFASITLEHEELHCKGWVHPGDNGLQEAFDKLRSNSERDL